MRIKIENYRNLKFIDYDIDDGKINFLFGLSGSGKSSILNALCNDEAGKNKTFGALETDNQIIEIDGVHVSPTEMHVFNVEKVNFILKDSTIETISEIIIADPHEHEQNHKILENRLKKLNEALKREVPKFEEIEKFLLELKIKKLNKGNSLPSGCILMKAISNIKSLGNKKLFKIVSSYDPKYVEWLNKGFDFVKDSKCPYCERKLSKKRTNKLGRIKNLDSDNIINLKREINNHVSLLGETLSFQYSEMKYMEKRLISFAKAIEVYKKINEQIYAMFEPNYDSTKFEAIIYDSDFKSCFPETHKEYRKLCKNIPRLVNAINKTHQQTDSFLKNKKGTINSLLEKADIPYKFDVTYHRGGPNEYFIVHKNSTDADNRESLSEGEKSIVSLILFLVSSSKTNYKLYMIDDPVSSFDNLRRRFIYNQVKKYLKGKTAIIFSHDAVFAKFALQDSKKIEIGKISYLSNNGIDSANLVSIKNLKLMNFNKCVINRLKTATGEYQKVILARLLLEEEYERSEKYSYLSKILHGNAYSDIMNWISSKSKTEKEYIDQINQILKSFGLKNNFLVPLNYSYNQIDTSDFTDFEKCILLRELIDNKTVNASPAIKEELNNYVHLNDVLDIMVNPFDFPMISRNLSDYLHALGSNYCL